MNCQEVTILIKKFINTKLISFLILSLVLSMAFVTPSVYAIEVDKVVAGDIEFLRSDGTDRKSTRLNSSHLVISRMPSSA